MSVGDGVIWNESLPDNSTLAHQIDDYDRDVRVGVRSRMAREHVWSSSQTATSEAGHHQFVTFQQQTGAPTLSTALTQVGALYVGSSGAGYLPTFENSAGATFIVHNSTESGSILIPKGIIVVWSGSTASIPAGWQLCDGTNGTPNLQDRFVIGAGSTYAVATTGGEATHTLTVGEMPSHKHTVDGYNNNGGATKLYYTVGAGTLGVTVDASSTGGDGAHNTLPPYYALAYIMKL
jgi:hypothetical protein